MSPQFDILGLGCVAVDELLYVPSFPLPDTKTRITRSERQCGGLAATALVAASRLGSKCAYAGTFGEDDLSRFVIAALKREGVDVSQVRIFAGARPIHSVIIVDESGRTRTILYDLERALGAQVDWPDASIISAARVLFIDHFGSEGMIRAAQIACSAGIPIVADFESNIDHRFPELLDFADHLLVSRAFGEKLSGEKDPTVITTWLWAESNPQVVVVTCGADGCWYLSRDFPDRPRHQPSFPVDVVDTTGCGDVFHGAYASALARGRALKERILIASAAAALKATRPGGQAGCPTAAEVDTFLRERTT
jgi:sugar/nucleoside kinase (ribokinase family)